MPTLLGGTRYWSESGWLGAVRLRRVCAEDIAVAVQRRAMDRSRWLNEAWERPGTLVPEDDSLFRRCDNFVKHLKNGVLCFLLPLLRQSFLRGAVRRHRALRRLKT